MENISFLINTWAVIFGTAALSVFIIRYSFFRESYVLHFVLVLAALLCIFAGVGIKLFFMNSFISFPGYFTLYFFLSNGGIVLAVIAFPLFADSLHGLNRVFPVRMIYFIPGAVSIVFVIARYFIDNNDGIIRILQCILFGAYAYFLAVSYFVHERCSSPSKKLLRNITFLITLLYIPQAIIPVSKSYGLYSTAYCIICGGCLLYARRLFPYGPKPVPAVGCDILSESVTAREREIIGLLTDGRSNREIAGQLFISEKTVKNHISSIYRKLGVKNRVQLIKTVYPELSQPLTVK